MECNWIDPYDFSWDSDEKGYVFQTEGGQDIGIYFPIPNERIIKSLPDSYTERLFSFSPVGGEGTQKGEFDERVPATITYTLGEFINRDSKRVAIYFCDQDERRGPNTRNRLFLNWVEKFQRNFPNIGLVYGDFWSFDSEGKRVQGNSLGAFYHKYEPIRDVLNDEIKTWEENAREKQGKAGAIGERIF